MRKKHLRFKHPVVYGSKLDFNIGEEFVMYERRKTRQVRKHQKMFMRNIEKAAIENGLHDLYYIQ